MGSLNKPYYRRDYTGETLTFVQNEEMASVFAAPRNLPHDLSMKNAIVLGNGLSRKSPEIELLLNVNRGRPAEGYKMTYACNAAYRDTPADYYVFRTNAFFSNLPTDSYNKIFTPNHIWLTYRDTNLVPYIYHMDAGSTAAYLAAFDGAKKVFLFGFDGTDGITSQNLYDDTLGYEIDTPIEDYQKFNTYLYDVVWAFKDTEFYRIRTPFSGNFSPILNSLPNYHEVSLRDAIISGDF